MAKININEYILWCGGLTGFIIWYLYGYLENHKDYDSSTLEYIHYLCGLISMLPLELAYGRIIWCLITKENFEINFLFSERTVLVK